MQIIVLRRLEKGESLEGIIPEIIEAFKKDHAHLVNFFDSDSECTFEVKLFDFWVYQKITCPEQRLSYMLMLLQRQKCDHFFSPQNFAKAIEDFYETTKEHTVNEYLASLESNCPTC